MQDQQKPTYEQLAQALQFRDKELQAAKGMLDDANGSVITLTAQLGLTEAQGDAQADLIEEQRSLLQEAQESFDQLKVSKDTLEDLNDIQSKEIEELLNRLSKAGLALNKEAGNVLIDHDPVEPLYDIGG